MKKLLSLVALLIVPAISFAADPKLDGYLGNLIRQAGTLLSQLLTFLIGLAVVWFIWNVVKYAMSNEEDGKDKAKSQMIHGIIAIAVIVSIWGIVAILRKAFGTEGGSANDINYESMIPGGGN